MMDDFTTYLTAKCNEFFTEVAAFEQFMRDLVG